MGRNIIYSGETNTITKNSSYIFVGTEGQTAIIKIEDTNFKIANIGGELVWNYEAVEEYTFTEVGQRRSGIAISDTSSVVYNVVYKGEGSFLFDIYLTENTFISKDNYIVIYRLGDSESESFADYYINAHNLNIINSNPSGNIETGGDPSGILWQVEGQKVGIACDPIDEILENQDVFWENIEEPIIGALNSEELISKNIWGIILGYNLPGGYYNLNRNPSGGFNVNPSGEDERDVIISSTSRLSRIRHTFSEKFLNKIYNRQVFRRFDGDDSNLLMIVSRIDGPTLQFAKNIVDNAMAFEKQRFANGKFYIDPYSDKVTTEARAYTDSLVDFLDNFLPTLNIDSWETIFMDPYIDVSIPYVENDSFMWSWFFDRATTSFFEDTNASRVFLYNADYDGGFTIRNSNSRRWPYLALNAGYIATAGAMSNPSISSFLNPNAFFYSLVKGATIGESFYFSCPDLDWTISLFGDPLSICEFLNPEDIEETGVINENVVWEIIATDVAQSAANLYSKEIELRDIVDEIVDITSETNIGDPSVKLEEGVSAALALLYTSNNLYLSGQTIVWKSHLKALIDKLFDFPTFRYFYQGSENGGPSVNEYLIENNFKISRLLASISQDSKPIIEENLLDEGWWRFEFILNDDDYNEYVNYHFILEVFEDENYSEIIFTKNSYAVTNWTYEKEQGVFSPLTSNGVSSSYIGRKVRYESRLDPLISLNEYLIRGQTYYFRITQYNLLTSEQYLFRDYNNIIYT